MRCAFTALMVREISTVDRLTPTAIALVNAASTIGLTLCASPNKAADTCLQTAGGQAGRLSATQPGGQQQRNNGDSIRSNSSNNNNRYNSYNNNNSSSSMPTTRVACCDSELASLKGTRVHPLLPAPAPARTPCLDPGGLRFAELR